MFTINIDKSPWQRMCNYAWSSLFGDSTSFTCVANKALNWVWHFNGRSLPDNASPQDTKNASTSFSQLHIKKADQENTGTYLCEGYDEGKLVETQACNLKVENNGNQCHCKLMVYA